MQTPPSLKEIAALALAMTAEKLVFSQMTSSGQYSCLA